jgi:D-alanyl-D-alanine carboxypeptidase
MAEVDQCLLQQAAGAIDGYVSEQQRVKDIPGIVVAFGHSNEILLSKAYGRADIEHGIDMTPDHAFRIASHSKMFTATACMLLLQAGKLRLDDRLEGYVDGLPEGVGQATIRQTLNHAAGIIRDGYDSDYWHLEYPFPDSMGVKRLAKEILQPNESFKYSNIGYSLVGLAIEKASGVSYQQYVREAIIERLGLGHTGPDTDDGVTKSLVTGYTGRQFPFRRMPIPDVPTGAMAAATGFYSTAEDLLRFARAHFLGNEELLTDASKREMQQPYWEVREAEMHYGPWLWSH